MKNKLMLSALLLLPSGVTPKAQVYQLKSDMLQALDQSGLLHQALLEIGKIGPKLLSLLSGKMLFDGVKLNLETTASKKIELIFQRSETIFGATFIIISPTDNDLFEFVTTDQLSEVKSYVESHRSKSILERQDSKDYDGIFTGSYATHPITKSELPIFIADYSISSFETRSGSAHLAIPAHDKDDFNFAQKQNLPVKVVISGDSSSKAEDQPVFEADGKTLKTPFLKNDSRVITVNSDFLNGTVKSAIENFKKYLEENGNGEEYKTETVYYINDKPHSISDIKKIESILKQNEHLVLSDEQKQQFEILMNYAQHDFIAVASQFLGSLKEYKSFLAGLVEESCKARDKENSYLLKWAMMNGAESEDVIFKRDIKSFTMLATFYKDLIEFLMDFKTSCPVSREWIKNLNNK